MYNALLTIMNDSTSNIKKTNNIDVKSERTLKKSFLSTKHISTLKTVARLTCHFFLLLFFLN